MPNRELQLLIACSEGVKELTAQVKELVEYLEAFVCKCEAQIEEEEGPTQER